jgi:O-acetyl-ADP-ribose deacetylase (regulator of RNase III)
MAKDFRHYCKQHNPKSGEIWTWGGVGGIRIVNLMCQESADNGRGGHPGKASISYVDRALKELARFVESEKIERLAIPKIATGVGGLAWDDVRSSIYKYLDPLQAKVFVYTTFQKGIKANED